MLTGSRRRHYILLMLIEIHTNLFLRIAKNVSAENTVTNVLASLSSTTGESAVANQNVQTSQVHANEIFANVIWTLHERCLHNMKFLM